MASAKPVVFSIFIVFLLVLGILNVITNFEENKCEMTWMFELPQYVPVPMPKSVIKRFPNYKLHVYGEGHYANMLGSMKMTGIPVLFIPGNAGSYKQVRSLGSVAFRRAVDKNKKYHFNFFSVDLNEEFSGLYGASLKVQTEYVAEAIKKIFSLYKHAPVKPKTIVLVGHSMGGMVARGLFTLPNFDAKQVNTIFMQATPNQYPVVVLDRELIEYHNMVNSYWKMYSNSTLSHITLVSSGGGEYDVQVRGGLTMLDGITDDDRSVSTSTTHTPKAWVSTDHRCIVWCKQVVFGFVRSLFDITDEDTHTISEDINYRMSVFRHHFLQHAGSIGHVTHWPKEIQLKPTGQWSILSDQVFKWSKEKVEKETYLAIPVIDYEDVDHAVIVSNIDFPNLRWRAFRQLRGLPSNRLKGLHQGLGKSTSSPKLQDSWICVCELKDGEKQCSTCTDISSTGNMLPPLYSHKKVVHIDLNSEEMSKITHIVVMMPASENHVEITGEVYSQDVRHLSNSVPGMLEVIMSYPESFTKGSMVLDLGRNAAFYKLKLYNLNNVVKVFTARLETFKCTDPAAGEHSGSVMRFHVPWSNEDTSSSFKYEESGNITLKLQYIPPDPVISPNSPDFNFDDLSVTNDYVELFIHLDPTCAYRLRLSMSFKEMLGQFVRFYGILMPSFCVAVLLMTLVQQLRTLATDGTCPSVLNSIWQIKPYNVVPIASILQLILGIAVVQKTLAPLNLPAPDATMLNQQGVMFKGMQLVMYLFALAVTTFQAGVIQLVLQFKSRLLGLIFGWLPSSVARILDMILLLVCVVGTALSATVCGSVGIFVCYFISFIQVLRLCYIARTSEDKTLRCRFHFYQTLFMLLLWLLILNSPPLVVLGKTLQAGQTVQVFSRDPSRVPGTLTAVTFLIIYSCNSPLKARSTQKSISYIIHILVILLVMYAMVTLYRITYVILVSLMLVAGTQLYGAITEKLTAPKPKTE